jgi:hypothetical protein
MKMLQKKVKIEKIVTSIVRDSLSEYGGNS